MVRNIELEQLVINKLTQEQFDNIEVKNPDELYFVTDAENDGGKGAQVEEMPEATEMNAGQIVQYVGETIPDIEATATITQTVGDSLTDLKVDAKKFAKASGLTEAGSLEFVADVYIDYGTILITAGNCPWFMSGTAEAIINAFNEKYGSFNDFQHTGYIVYRENSDSFLFCPNWDPDNGGLWISCTKEELESFGFQFNSNVLQNGDFNEYFYSPGNGITINWKKDAIDVGINQYGITYSGTPSNGDTIKVDYTPFVGGYEKGYFYVNQAQLSEPTVTIEQTVGDSLSNLSVDVDKFIEAEQPSDSETVSFVASVTEGYYEDLSSQYSHDFIVSFDVAKYQQHCAESSYPTDWCIIINTNGLEDGYWQVGRGFDNIFATNLTLSDLETTWGITITNVSGNDNVAVFRWENSQVTWSKNGTIVDLAEYGISYSGAPADGDTLTVSCSAPAIIGYAWNQINVQPASKGNGGIEWVTKLDLPADYPGQYAWSCYPIWTIPGGVPDGTYEFYIQTLCGTEHEPERAGVQNYTVKVLVKFYTKNNRQYHFGSVSYVVDGTWTGDTNFRPTEARIYNAFRKGNNNLYFSAGSAPFQSYLPAYAGSVAVPGIFKTSTWKNIDSGETYIPEGMLYTGNRPVYETTIEGVLESQPLYPPVIYPSFYSYHNVNISEINQYARIVPEYLFNDGTSSVASAQSATFDIKSNSGGTFYATIKNKNGSCVVEELESSGDLKNVQLGVGDDGYSYIYFNNNDLQVEVLFSLTGIKNTESDANITFDSWVAPSSFTPLTIERVGAPITALNFGKTLQYTQESTDEYTKGYFYKSSGTQITNPASMEVTWQSVDGVEILIDAEKLAQAIGSYVGWDVSYVKNDLLRYNRYYVYYENEGSPYVHADFYGDFHDSSIVECFTINGELPDKYIEFNAGNYKDFTIEIIDGKWEQINVQPASNTVQVTEIPEASEENVGRILQYIGTPTSEYDQGYFYKCTADGWVQVNVQPSSGGGGEAPSELPNLTGNEGRFLSNNGSELEWADIPTSLPAQEGHSGKYLTTDGENASWVEIELPESTDGVELPDQTGNSGKFLTTDGANLSWAEVSSGGGTVSGDYLPLSGGTLTGALKLHDDNMWNTDIVLEAMDYGVMGGTVLNISGGTIVAGSIHPSGQYSSLGTPYNQEMIDAGGGYGVEGLYYQRVCAKALNSGTTNDDIVIPSKSGTLALIEDIEAVMGDLSSALDAINGEEI